MMKNVFMFVLKHMRNFFSSTIGKVFSIITTVLGALLSAFGIKKDARLESKTKKQ